MPRRLKTRLNTAGEGCGLDGAPNSTMVPSRFSSEVKASRLCGAATVLTIRSKLFACLAISASSFDTTTSSAPSALPSATLSGEVVKATVCAPSAWLSLTPIWPSPPMPTMPTFLPGPAPQCFSGDQVVMPAHSSGATAARSFSAWLIASTKCSSTVMAAL